MLARAPLLLSESLLFPYREGLSFEQDVWMDQGQKAAFAGALDRPPSSTWEIINPREFEKAKVPVVPLMPDIHPIVDKTYKAYDIGQVGELDLHILTELFGGENAARDLTPSWDGGIYWAGQRLSAKTPAEQASTKSISLFYLSAWKNAAAAQAFAELYAERPGPQVLRPAQGRGRMPRPRRRPAGTMEQVFTTNEGPVVITTRGTAGVCRGELRARPGAQAGQPGAGCAGHRRLRMASSRPSPHPHRRSTLAAAQRSRGGTGALVRRKRRDESRSAGRPPRRPLRIKAPWPILAQQGWEPDDLLVSVSGTAAPASAPRASPPPSQSG